MKTDLAFSALAARNHWFDSITTWIIGLHDNPQSLQVVGGGSNAGTSVISAVITLKLKN